MSLDSRSSVPRIYGLADFDVLARARIDDAVRRIADGGIEWIQVRAKNATDAEFAMALEACCRALEDSAAKLWVNDRPDLARLFPVQGVHVGQDDLPPFAARRIVGDQKLIGRSTHSVAQVCEADADRAVDIIAIGPVFSTTGKRNPQPVVGLEGLRQARRSTSKPLVAIGGIDEHNLVAVLDAGADSAAMLGAVCVGDVEANSRRLTAKGRAVA